MEILLNRWRCSAYAVITSGGEKSLSKTIASIRITTANGTKVEDIDWGNQ